MKLETEIIQFSTKGQNDLIDLTKDLKAALTESGIQEGQMTIFVIGSTAGISTIEYEPGLIKDMKEVFEKIAPRKKDYHHHETWGDDNGSSHIRATIQGPSLTIPFTQGNLLLGTWQQVVLMEFDTRNRTRKVVVQIMGK